MTSFFFWNKSFEVGIEAIDSQHRRLVDLINALAAAVTEGGQLPLVQALFGDLMEYAAIHFRDEERLMDSAPLPEADKQAHRRAHQAFVDKARQIKANPNLHQAQVAEQVLEFLTTWLISHILGSDKKIARALQPPDHEPQTTAPMFDVSPVERVLLGALTETERRFRLISDQSPVYLWVADASGHRSFVNRIWMEFIGCEDAALADPSWRAALHPQDRAAYLALTEQLLVAPAPSETEYRMLRHDGQSAWFLERILPRIDSNQSFLGLVACATDITTIKQAEVLLTQSNQALQQEVARRTAQLEQLILSDPLTGVGNRRMLTKRMAEETIRAQRYQRPFSVIFFDLDHFKHINDTYGHAVGDAVLVGATQSLMACLRECDVLGRYGGEEFIVLLPETGLQDAMQVAERMRASVAAMRLEQLAQAVTVSAGVAESKPDETGNALIARADQALYRAKAAGRDCCRAASD